MVKFKKTTIFMIVILFSCCNLLTSCSEGYSFEEVKQEFSQYEADLNTAVVLDYENLYFYDRVIKLEEIIPEGEVSNFQLIGNDIYFLAKKLAGWLSFSLDFWIYKYNIDENNVVCVFKKENIRAPFEYLYNGETLYFQYKIKGSSDKIIDSYNLVTGEYENIVRGKDCNINNYKEEVAAKKYSCKINSKNNEISIQDTETSETFTVNDDYLKETPYYSSLNKYPYSLDEYSQYKGNLYIIYRLWIESYEFFPDYTFVVFEFDFANKDLIYKTIVQMYDIEIYTIINIGE